MSTAGHDMGMNRIAELLAAAKANRPVKDVNADAPRFAWDKARHFTSVGAAKLNEAMKKAAASLAAGFNSIAPGKESLINSQPVVQMFLNQILRDSPSEEMFTSVLTTGTKVSGAAGMSVKDVLGMLGDILDDKGGAEDMSRKLSPLENSLLTDLFATACNSVASLMKAAGGVELNATAPARQKLEIGLHGKTEFCVIVFEIKVGQCQAKMMLYIASDDLDCLTVAAGAKEGPSKEQIRRSLLEKIGKVHVQVDTVIARTEANFSQVMGLAPGDIIVFEQKIDEPSTMMLKGKRLFGVKLGRCDGHYALAIGEQETQTD